MDITTPNLSEKADKRRIDPAMKQKVLDLIQDGSIRVSDAAATYHISQKTIYGWLAQTAVPGQEKSTELIKLKRENRALLELVGKLTQGLESSKKKSWRKVLWQ